MHESQIIDASCTIQSFEMDCFLLKVEDVRFECTPFLTFRDEVKNCTSVLHFSEMIRFGSDHHNLRSARERRRMSESLFSPKRTQIPA